MKKCFFIITLLIVLGVGTSYSQTPIRDSLKAYHDATLDSSKTYTFTGNAMYGIIYIKNVSTDYDTICVQKFTITKKDTVQCGVVNLDSSGTLYYRIIVPPDNKYHTWGINHIYPGNIMVTFTNKVWNASRKLFYEINYYQK
jgi:hypothetical protein